MILSIDNVNVKSTLRTSIIPFIRTTQDKLRNIVTLELVAMVGLILVTACIASPWEFFLVSLLATVALVVPSVRDLLIIILLAGITTIITILLGIQETMILFTVSSIAYAIKGFKKLGLGRGRGLGFLLLGAIIAGTYAGNTGIQEFLFISALTFTVLSVVTMITMKVISFTFYLLKTFWNLFPIAKGSREVY
ncbi:hypothetical protein K7432_011210 [Basidiobolus ranarum]|uniref:Uncharacterized protein n=1 Tax=Basidiobolus ranarum TaxID=34480 RepID=A0ABR2VU88_9FUNG